jgi:cholesterol transport system auxiliary component
MRNRITGDALWAAAGRGGRFGIMAVAALLSAGCGGSLFQSELPAPTRYIISPLPPVATPSTTVASAVDIAIGRPDVAPGLDTDAIATLRGYELDYYRGALWRGTVLETVQDFLVSTFQDQKLFHSVAKEQARVAGDYLLDVEVRDFQSEYVTSGSAPVAHVTLIGRVVRVRDRKLIEVMTATASQPARENRLSAVAAAFESAMREVSLDLARRTAERAGQDQAAAPADE